MGMHGLQENGTVIEETRIVSWPEPPTSLSLPQAKTPRPEAGPRKPGAPRPHRFAGWTALITGASAGLGEEFARQLAPLLVSGSDPEKTGRLILVARRQDRLIALGSILRAIHPSLSVEIVRADLSNAAEVEALAARLAGEEIDLLVNNAGLGDSGLFEHTPSRRIGDLVRLNVEALAQLTLRLVPGMIERRRGAVINLGSVAGFLPLPTRALYAASKAFVNSFSEALRWEMDGTGVTVTAICPGPVPTEFFVAERRDPGVVPPSNRFHDMLHISAEQTVRESIAAATAGKSRLVPGRLMRTLCFFLHRTPLAFLRIGYWGLGPMYRGLRRR